jgi:iron-only hydrogenase maturation protein HydG
MYDVKSKVAEEFIDDGEIVATMEYARANRHNRALIEHILDKAEAAKGITHREAAVLLECDLPDLNDGCSHWPNESRSRYTATES